MIPHFDNSYNQNKVLIIINFKMQVQKSNKNVKSKKNQKFTPKSNEEEERNSSSCSSEEDDASQDSNRTPSSDSKVSEAQKSNGKARTSRGSATDPQSLYARVTH